MSLAAICGVLFFVGLGLLVFKVSRKFAAWAFLFSGVGIAGAIGGAQSKAASTLTTAGKAITGATVGTTVLLALVAFIGLYLFSRMWKGGGGGFLTSAVAFVFPAILTAFGAGAVVALMATILRVTGSTVGTLFAGLGA